MELFVSNGFATLLDKIGTLEAERQLEHGIWHAYGDKTKPGLNFEPDLEEKGQAVPHTLLYDAVERELPNMEVVRLLVEKFHVNVNAFLYKHSEEDNKWMPKESALHHLAKGFHWWHVAQALPYLISQGADLNLKGTRGRTPLHFALHPESDEAGTFLKQAAKNLIEAGADVNALDNQGKSCLAYATKDIEMLKFMSEHGAILKADSLFATIDEGDPGLLEAVLSAGADPNMRCEPLPPLKTGVRQAGISVLRYRSLCYETQPHEIYPLFAAAMRYEIFLPVEVIHKRGERLDEARENALRLTKVLLAYGADPYGTFTRKNPYYHSGGKGKYSAEELHGTLAFRKSRTQREFEETTVLHQLLASGHLVHTILTMPGLDPDRRDGQGRTLLHVACLSRFGVDSPIDALYLKESSDHSRLPLFYDQFLGLGADALATDNDGQNVLHHMLDHRNPWSQHPYPNPDTITYLAKRYPALLTQTERNFGRTPLHMAFIYAVYRIHDDQIGPAEALLDAGANPFATDRWGNTALHILAYGMYKVESVRALFAKLLSRRLDINARNYHGETPLFNLNKKLFYGTPHEKVPAFVRKREPHTLSIEEAVRPSESFEIFEKVEADFFATDNEGSGLLHVVAKRTTKLYADIFSLLIQKGLDPMMEDNRRTTALDVAATYEAGLILRLYARDDEGSAKA